MNERERERKRMKNISNFSPTKILKSLHHFTSLLKNPTVMRTRNGIRRRSTSGVWKAVMALTWKVDGGTATCSKEEEEGETSGCDRGKESASTASTKKPLGMICSGKMVRWQFLFFNMTRLKKKVLYVRRGKKSFILSIFLSSYLSIYLSYY